MNYTPTLVVSDFTLEEGGTNLCNFHGRCATAMEIASSNSWMASCHEDWLWTRRRVTNYINALKGEVPVLISEKVKFGNRNSVPQHDTWKSGGIAPRILDLGTRLRWVASVTSRTFYPRYATDMKLGGPHSRSGHFGRKFISTAWKPTAIPWPPTLQPTQYT